MSNRALCMAVWLAAAPPLAATEGVTCHIHPPGSTPERPVNIIGPYATVDACEQARAERFGPEGRCHCVSDFSPRWLPPAEGDRPGQSPLG
ncbi:hypothetical protein [Thiosocius teredinicola]|uniref:hypothetical protein n=1 Tax=Thiosocius teredinicola TaxID=1973002 RepID=UPI000F7B1B3D